MSLSDMVDRCQCADGDPGTTAASCVDGSAHTAMGWDLSGRDRSWRTGMLSTDERSVVADWGHGVQYLVPWARLGTAKEETQDARLGKKLWAWMEAQVRDA